MKGNLLPVIRPIDKSYLWAKGILAANKHYIDNNIVPMPCPAEYNFYFTHDVLVTDYAAVNFDFPELKMILILSLHMRIKIPLFLMHITGRTVHIKPSLLHRITGIISGSY